MYVRVFRFKIHVICVCIVLCFVVVQCRGVDSGQVLHVRFSEAACLLTVAIYNLFFIYENIPCACSLKCYIYLVILD